MEQNRTHRIASLKAEILLLQKQERRLESIISLKSTDPAYRRQAQGDLRKLLTRIRELEDELTRLEATQ